MKWPDLAHTLIGLVTAIQAPPDSGLTVYEADLDIPLEVTTQHHGGELVFYGRVPHSRWKAGFQPPVHMSHVNVIAVRNDQPSAGTPEAGAGGEQ